MWLRELAIRNFRRVEDLTINFPRGLCIFVGENNAGKTAIIDALRIILFPSRDFDALHISEDDFRAGTDFAPIEISCTFADLKEDDEVHFQECLIDIGNGNFEVRLNTRIEFNKLTRRPNVKSWGGETEGGYLPSNLFDRIVSIYLKPLRDPESGLRPGRHSQVCRLIDCLTSEDQHADFESILSDANNKIKVLDPVKTARDDINTHMVSITGEQLTQKTELIFSDPTFHRIIAGLQPEIEGLPFALNGLGYNNLIFTSTTLGTLRRSSQFSFRSILVEEPEAHLHPQLQVLLLRHFVKVTGEKSGNEVQVIASSHSPILVSQAPIDSIVSIHECDGKVQAVSIGSIKMAECENENIKLKKKLQRYLDATRGELFFARRLLMVEGIAEALLLPVLAKIAGGCLRDCAVTVLNAEGLNFNAFLPLFGQYRLGFPVAILTDGDSRSNGGKPSSTAVGLMSQEAHIKNLKVAYCDVTFEHELAKSSDVLSLMLNAFEKLHPQNKKKLEEAISKLSKPDEKADAFLDEFIRSRTPKGQFAQELAQLLETANLPAGTVPNYIREAFKFLGVIKEEVPDGRSDKAA